jgi:hypothetical protein
VPLQHVEQPAIMVDVSSSSPTSPTPYVDAREARSAIEAALADRALMEAAGAERRAELRSLLRRLSATVDHFEQRMEAAERESALDPLTGLANRRAWRNALRAAEERCRRGAEPAVVAVIDLDDFKEINDTRGMRRATPSWTPSPAPCAPQCVPATPWPAPVVTSSPCWRSARTLRTWSRRAWPPRSTRPG